MERVKDMKQGSAGAAQREKDATPCNGRVTESGLGLQGGEKLVARSESGHGKRESFAGNSEKAINDKAQDEAQAAQKSLQVGRWCGVVTVVLLGFFAFGMLADEGHDATLSEFFLQKLAGCLVFGAAWIIGRAMTIRGYWPDMMMRED